MIFTLLGSSILFTKGTELDLQYLTFTEEKFTLAMSDMSLHISQS